MSLNKLKEIKSLMEAQSKALYSEAKMSINDEINTLLSQPDIESIGWAAKSGEYNDEGMYPGVVGPFLNIKDVENKANLVYEEATSKDNRLNNIKEILNTAGQDILTEIFGDEAIVVASLNKHNKVSYKTESIAI